jgi:hypothetical protein
MDYAKVIHKKRERKTIGKNGQVSKMLKQRILRCPPKKRKRRKMNKIAHVLLQKYFQVSKERYVFKEPPYIPHTCTF